MCSENGCQDAANRIRRKGTKKSVNPPQLCLNFLNGGNFLEN